MEEIKPIEAKVVQFYDQINQIQLLQDDESFNGVHSSVSMSMENRTMVDEEITVGFDDEALTIKELLARGKKQLQMISIFGMPGLGKTTLATKLYNDPYITHYFHIRAWTYASQLPSKTEMLLDILRSVNVVFTHEIENTTNENLGEKLHKQLKGKRYLIVLTIYGILVPGTILKCLSPMTTMEVELCSLVGSKRPHLIAILIICVFSLKQRVGSYYNRRCFKMKDAL
ncbi:unnamed protein product [Camellia sinensis]